MSKTTRLSDPHVQTLIEYYQNYDEDGRLQQPQGQLELIRTQEILNRFLPSPPAVIYDIGGGTGIYSCWLARHGYEVHLVDIVPEHIELARKASLNQPAHPIASLTVGDARHIERRDESVDAVLLMGPLYHLTTRKERLQALKEANRILRNGGILLGASISRFASLIDGIKENFLDDHHFVEIVRQDLKNGQHRNPTDNPDYFTNAYFHHPDELKEEVTAAEFEFECTLAVEGPGQMVSDINHYWNDPVRREKLLNVLRMVEEEPTLIGFSAHLMVVARKLSLYSEMVA